MRARFRSRGNGTYELRLSRREKGVLRSIPSQAIELLRSNDPSTQRVFPPAYDTDEESEAEYRRLVGEQLIEHHEAALQVMEDTVDASTIGLEQAEAWLVALNDVRLILGTRLEVQEDDAMIPSDASDPRDAALGIYHYLGWLQQQVVDALADNLPETGDETPS